MKRLLGRVAEVNVAEDNAVHPEARITGTTKPVGSLVIHEELTTLSNTTRLHTNTSVDG